MTKTGPAGIRGIAYVMLFVRDMNRSVAFYRDQLGLPPRMVTPHWTEFDLPGTTLALHLADAGWPPAPAPAADPGKKVGAPNEIVFTADDPLAVRDELARRGVRIAPPKHVYDAGDRVGVSCLFEDPDGNLLSVYGLVAKTVWDARR